MALLNAFRSWFSKPVSSSSAPQTPAAAVEPTAEQRTDTPANQPERLEWIENEEELRDEGVLFGLSDSVPDEKTRVIRTYFAQRSAVFEHQLCELHERIGEINLMITYHEERAAKTEERLGRPDGSPPGADAREQHLLRTTVGLLAAVAISVSNFYLVHETFQPLFRQSFYVSLGVFLAGMFNLFGGVSYWYTEPGLSRRPRWKQLLEEVGLPLAAAFFVFVQAIETQSLLRASALFAFVLFVFLFSGKLLLSNLTLFKSDWHVLLTRHRTTKASSARRREGEREVKQLRREVEQLREEKQRILPRLTHLTAELARVNARRDLRINLFESEFSLSRNLKDRLTSEQVKSITN